MVRDWPAACFAQSPHHFIFKSATRVDGRMVALFSYATIAHQPNSSTKTCGDAQQVAPHPRERYDDIAYDILYSSYTTTSGGGGRYRRSCVRYMQL